MIYFTRYLHIALVVYIMLLPIVYYDYYEYDKCRSWRIITYASLLWDVNFIAFLMAAIWPVGLPFVIWGTNCGEELIMKITELKAKLIKPRKNKPENKKGN